MYVLAKRFCKTKGSLLKVVSADLLDFTEYNLDKSVLKD